MFDFELTWGYGAKEGRKDLTPPPLPFSLFLTDDHPLVQILFSPQLSAAIWIRDDGYNFRWVDTEHSLAKITPALQPRLNTTDQLYITQLSYTALSLHIDRLTTYDLLLLQGVQSLRTRHNNQTTNEFSSHAIPKDEKLVMVR